MTERTARELRFLSDLIGRVEGVEPDELVGAVAEVCGQAGFRGVGLYLVDQALQELVPVPAGGGLGAVDADADADTLAVEGSDAGRAFRSGATVEVDEGAGTRVWVPVTEAAERSGVLTLVGRRLDAAELRWCADLGRLVAQLLRVRTRYTDVFTCVRRVQPMSVAAELQWTLLPPLDFATPGVAVAGMVEPAYDVGGDAFDYALNDGVLHVALFDSMGHALDASLVAGLAVGSYRNARRRGFDLAATVATIDEAVAVQHDGDRFVTAQIGRLDTRSGVYRWVNAGHPPPLIMRRGKVVDELRSPPRLPLGLGGEPGIEAERTLEEGDCLVVYSDGVTEARDPGGGYFGAGALAASLERAWGPPISEVARALVSDVLDHQQGPLRDDATLLLVELAPAAGR